MRLTGNALLPCSLCKVMKLAGIAVFSLISIFCLRFLLVQERQGPVAKHLHDGKTLITGFKYTNIKEGKTIMSVEAKSAIMNSKKIGMVRLGLLKQIDLFDVEIHLYDRCADPYSSVTPTVQRNEEMPRDERFQTSSILGVAASFRERYSRIAGVYAHNVKMVLHHCEGGLTRIRSRKLHWEKGGHDLFFQGNVRVNHAHRALTSPEVRVNVAQTRFRALKGFALFEGGNPITGKSLLCDVRLTPLHTQ